MSRGEKIVFTIENTFESDSYGETGEKQCKFMKEVLRGITSYYWETDELTTEELECRSEGYNRCKMVTTIDE